MLIGASGKLGQAIEAAASGTPYFRIVQRVTRDNPELRNLDEVDLVLDVSRPDVLNNNLHKIVLAKKPLVVGTTGHSELSLKALEEASKEIPVLYCPNFAPGISLIKKMLSHLPTTGIKTSIHEVHHTSKKDAPSGTAKDLAIIALTPDNKISSERIEGIIGEHTIQIELEDEIIKISHSALSRNLYAKGAIKACQFLSNKEKGLYTNFHDEDSQHYLRQR